MKLSPVRTNFEIKISKSVKVVLINGWPAQNDKKRNSKFYNLKIMGC